MQGKSEPSSIQMQGRGRRMLSVQEAARYLGIAPKTLYNRTHRRATNPFPVKAKKIGNRTLFDSRDLEKFVDSI